MDYDLKIVMEDVEMLEAGDEVIAEGDYYKAPTISDVQLYNNACTGALGIGETVSDMLTFRINDPRSLVNDGARVDFYILATDLEGEDTLMSIEDEVGSTATDEILADDEDEKTGYVDEDDEDAEIDEEDEDEEDADPEDAQDAAEVDADLADGADATMEGEDIEEGEEDIDDESEEDDAEWEHIGVFYVYGQKTDVDGSLLITCFDGLARMTGNFIPESATATVAEMYADLADKVSEDCGIELEELEFDAIEEQEINWNFTATYREAFGYFAGLLGGYAEFDEDGVLGVSWYTYDDDILIKSELLNYEEDSSGEMTVENLVCSCGRSALSGAILEAGSGGQSASFSNPFMTQSQLDGIFELYKGIRFTGATLTALWDDELTAGKFIRIMTEDEYTNYLQIRNYIAQNADSQDSDVIARLPELRDGMNSLGRIILISRQVIDFKGEAMTLITSTCGSEAAKDSVATPQLNQAVSDAMQAMDAIEADIEDLEDRVDAAEDAVTEIESDITALGTRITTAEGNITTIEGSITTLGNRVTAAEGDIDAVEGNITALQGRVADAEDDIDDTLKGLALAQDIVGTLAWITAHSSVTSDTTPVSGKTYYIKNQDNTFTPVTDTTGKNPHNEGWYQLDEALQNYIMSHLALGNDGLYVLKDNSHWKVRVGDTGVDIIDNTSGLNKVVAQYKDEIILGPQTEQNIRVDSDSMDIRNGSTILAKITGRGMKINGEGSTAGSYQSFVDIGGASRSSGDDPYLTLGSRKSQSSIASVIPGRCSVAIGENLLAAGTDSVAEGNGSIASGDYTHAEGESTWAEGQSSHAEGSGTGAHGRYAHAEGYETSAGAVYADWACHAEGRGTDARGEASHAEGKETRAEGIGAHAEGYNTQAGSSNISADYSHVQNEGTEVLGKAQTAIGTYNVVDIAYPGTHPGNASGSGNPYSGYHDHAFIIGNGYIDSNDDVHRSNAFAVSWNGDVEAAGDMEAAGDVVAGNVSLQNHTHPEKADASHTHGGPDITSLTYGSSKLFYVETSDSVSLASLAAGSTKSGSISKTKTGYYPLGIVGYHVSGTTVSGVNVYNMYLSVASTGSYTLQYGIRNVMANTALSSNCAIEFKVLWVKV